MSAEIVILVPRCYPTGNELDRLRATLERMAVNDQSNVVSVGDFLARQDIPWIIKHVR